MRLHRRIARDDMCRQGDGDRRSLSTLFAAALQRQLHGVGMRHIAIERIADAGLQISGAVALQQA